MSIKKHPDFFYPKNNNQKVWKYMDIAKFLYLVTYKKLFFSSIANLSSDDPFEGSITHASADGRRQFFLSLDDLSPSQKIEQINNMTNLTKNFRNCIYINCWSMHEHESVALWNQFVGNKTGVAISTTLEKLSNNIGSEKEIFASEIRYIDYILDTIPLNNLFFPALHKRKHFEFENELRLIAWEPSLLHIENTNDYPSGIEINIDIKSAISEIVFSPSLPTWQKTLFLEICKRNDIDHLIKESKLNLNPTY